MSVINGLIAALTTPFTVDGIDVKALQQHIMLLNDSVTGFAIGGTTGESLSLNDDELITLLQATSAVAGDKLLIAGFWRATTQLAIDTAKRIAEYTDVLLVPIPADLFQQDDAAIADFYAQIAKTTFKPILIYNFPEHCEQRAIGAQLAETIAKNNINIIGVKDSSSDAKLVKDIITYKLSLQPILGNDRFLVESLELSQKHKCTYQLASISGACSVPKIAETELEIYRLCSENNYTQANILQQDLLVEYFKPWAAHALKLGGKSPVIKSLLATTIQGYPIMVRAPLKEHNDPNNTDNYGEH